MHSHASGTMIQEGRESHSLMCQGSGCRIGGSCRNIMGCCTFLVALIMILSIMIAWPKNSTQLPHFLLAILIGVPLLVVGGFVCHYLRIKRGIREGEASQTRFQVTNTALVINNVASIVFALSKHHTVPNGHPDRPRRQQLTAPTAAFDPYCTESNSHRDRPRRQQSIAPTATFDPHHTVSNGHPDRSRRHQSITPTAAFDPHHYVVVADSPNSPKQEGPDVPSPHDSPPSYDTAKRYNYLYKVPQLPSS